MPFVIDANLDCEAKWSGLALSQPVLMRIGLYGALVSVLAPRGEPVELWTPGSFDRARWRGGGITAFRTGVPPPEKADLRWADPEARAANDRRLALEVAQRHGFALPGARVITSVEEIDLPAWIAKVPWTAAGRDRVRGDGVPNAEQRTRLGRLLAATGALVVEPWCERVLDVGTCGTVDAGGSVQLEAAHGLIVDARGGFVGIDLAVPKLETDERELIERAARAAGEAIAAIGYRGPFAIDAFVYRSGDRRAVQPLCEINARYSFGWIARAYSRRTGCTRLGFGPPQADRAQRLIENRDDNIQVWIA